MHTCISNEKLIYYIETPHKYDKHDNHHCVMCK